MIVVQRLIVQSWMYAGRFAAAMLLAALAMTAGAAEMRVRRADGSITTRSLPQGVRPRIILPRGVSMTSFTTIQRIQGATRPTQSRVTRKPTPKPTPAVPGGVLRGKVTDENGKPLEGATVNIQGAGYASEKTGADGTYSFPAVKQPGQYRIGVSAAGHIGITGYREMPMANLTNKGQVTRDFTLKPACTLKVLVVDQAGKPVSGVRLIAMLQGASFRMMGEASSSVTDTSGTAVLTGMPPNETPYQITAMYSPGWRRGAPKPDPEEGYALARLQVKLTDPAKQESGLIELEKGVTVKGRAICSDGKPAAGWEIQARPDWWNSYYVPRGYPIDEQGNFTLHHVTPGKYQLSVSIPRGDSSSIGVPLTVADLPLKEGLLELKIPRPSPGSQVSISGKVKIKGQAQGNDSRRVVDGYRMIMISAYNSSVNESANMMSGEDFKIEGLQPGIYTLRFSSGTTREKTIENVKAPAEGLVVELEPLVKPVLRAVVVDAATSAPVQTYRARVSKSQTLSGPNYVQEMQWIEVSDKEGRFEQEVSGPGIYQVQAAAPGKAWTWSEPINTDTDASRTVTIRLAPGVALKGTVVDEAGKPVAGARVLPVGKAGLGQGGLTRVGNLEEFEVKSGADGAFKIDDLPPGTESLRVEHRDYCSTATAALEIAVDARVRLRRGATVAGHVYDEKGRPQAGVTLLFANRQGYSSYDAERGGGLATVVTDEQGAYKAEHLPEALCYVSREEAWQALGVVVHTILPRADKTLTLDFGGRSQLTGRVLKDGKPLANTKVLAGGDRYYFSSYFRAVTTTDAEGKFCFYGIPAGRRGLWAEMDGTRSDYVPIRAIDIKPADAAGEGRNDLGDLTLPEGRATITVASDAPTSAATRAIYVIEPSGEDDYSGSQAGRVEPKTDPQGPTVVTGLVPGRRYAAVASINNFVTLRQPFTFPADQKAIAVTVKIPAGKTMLDGFYRLKEQLPLMLVSEDRRVYANPYPEKEYYNIEDLPPGNYQFCIQIGGSLKPVRSIKLEAGMPESIDIEGPEWEGLKTPTEGYLSVQVFTEGGLPLPGAQTVLTKPGETLKAASDYDHTHTFVGVPGAWRLKVSAPGYRAAEREVKLESMKAADGMLRPEPATVQVRLEREP